MLVYICVFQGCGMLVCTYLCDKITEFILALGPCVSIDMDDDTAENVGQALWGRRCHLGTNLLRFSRHECRCMQEEIETCVRVCVDAQVRWPQRISSKTQRERRHCAGRSMQGHWAKRRAPTACVRASHTWLFLC